MRNPDQHLSDHDLVLAVDRELPSPHQVAADAHLVECASCRIRRGRLHGVSAVVDTLRASAPAGDAHIAASRDHLRSTLSTMGADRYRSLEDRVTSALTLFPRWSLAGAALAAMALLAGAMYQLEFARPGQVLVSVESGALPVALLTPGATWSVTVGELCAPGGRQQRPVSEAIRAEVLRGYGMQHVPAREYELDYLITPELGGAPAVPNLWPQRYASRVWNAHVKDQLERLLPGLVCDGSIPLETAQREIAADWITAYKKYFRTDAPLQSHALVAGRFLPEPDDGILTYPVWRPERERSLRLISLSAAR
jgi:hypothetical protein